MTEPSTKRRRVQADGEGLRRGVELCPHLVQHFDIVRDARLIQTIVDISDAWTAKTMAMFGSECKQNRRTCKYGDAGIAHCYSGDTTPVRPWPPAFLPLLALLREQGLLPDGCNLCICNRYDNTATEVGSIGWHADDEPDLDQTKEITTVSLGTEMEFLVRDKTGKKTKRLDHRVAAGSVLVMLPGFQDLYEHCVPARKYYKNRAFAKERVLGTRISLTFRTVYTA